MAKIDEYKLKRSAQFALTGTQEETTDLQLTQSTLSSSGIITGTVTSGGLPLEGATVKVFDTLYNPVAHDISGPVGQYIIPEISAGTYRVTATKDGYLTPVSISVTVSANRPTTVNISLTPDPDAGLNTIFGIVSQISPVAPIDGATVNVYSVVGADRTLIMTTISNSTGQYLAPYLADGDYVVVVNKAGYYQTESETNTVSGGEIAPLNLVLNPNPATNTGTVGGSITDQSTLTPIANATVALYQIVGSTETIVKLTKTTEGGRYLFGGVAEGEYVVKAFAQTEA